jgi:hypothetical protein
VLANGKRVPGLKLDHPRQLAVMSFLVRFSHVAAGDTFTTAELQEGPKPSISLSEKCPLSSVRYELSKLRAKDLVEKLHILAAINFVPPCRESFMNSESPHEHQKSFFYTSALSA